MSRAQRFPRERFHRFRPSLSNLPRADPRTRHAFDTVWIQFCRSLLAALTKLSNTSDLLNPGRFARPECSKCRYPEEHSPISRRSWLAWQWAACFVNGAQPNQLEEK